MSERKLAPAQFHKRAIRDFEVKIELYCRGKKIDPAHHYGWAWDANGIGINKAVPSMQQIEDWFIKNAMCETCKGLKYIHKPLNNLSPHGTMKCLACRGKGYTELEDA